MANPAYVAHVANATSGAASSLSATISSSAGETLVVNAEVRGNEVPVITDSAGNTYTTLDTQFQSVTMNAQFICVNATPVTSVTMTISGSFQLVIDVVRLSDVGSYTAGGTPGHANSAAASVAVTTTGANDLVVASVGAIAAATFTLTGTGYTHIAETDATGASGNSLATAYGSFASAGSHDCTWTVDTTRQWTAVAVILHAAATVIDSGTLDVTGTGTVTIASSDRVVIGGTLVVVGTGAVAIASSDRVAVAGALAVSASEAIAIASYVRIVDSGNVNVHATGGAGVVTVSDYTFDAVAGALAVAASEDVAIATSAVTKDSGLLKLRSVDDDNGVAIEIATSAVILDSGLLELKGIGLESGDPDFAISVLLSQVTGPVRSGVLSVTGDSAIKLTVAGSPLSERPSIDYNIYRIFRGW